MNITLIEHEETQKMVGYSFGDHSGVMGGVPNAFIKKANYENLEFREKVKNHNGEVMTLFIDNIRLYYRQLEYSDWQHNKPISDSDREYLSRYKDEDLLELCSKFPKKKFIIFTAFEDTPLDGRIEGRIPDNVIRINAVNSAYLNDKILPMPHGVERIMYNGYNHHEILGRFINDKRLPTKLMYVNHREDTGSRTNLREMFKDWATISQRLAYKPYLEAIKDHKFVLCPSGNGIESARNWETLYLRRVPVFQRHPYMEKMYDGFPVLFIDDFTQLTSKILQENDNLFTEVLNLDMKKLDLISIFKEKTIL